MSYKKRFTYDQIAKTFTYEAKTGKLMRKLSNGVVRELKVAIDREKWGQGTVTNQIKFGGYLIPSTYIMWMLMKGRWPKEGMVMDHRNGDVYNTRWSNLRELTWQQSNWNKDYSAQRWVSEDGLERGVTSLNGRYKVMFYVNSVQRYVGTYDSKEEANRIARKVIEEVQGDYSYAASRRPKPKSWRRI